MWFSLFAIVLVLAITFIQGLQGLFTALINFVLTALAAALAFGFHESLYFNYLIEYQPEHGRAIALMSIFIVSLLIMRTVFDLAITQNVHFPVYVDRAVGGVLGLFTALIIVGMLAISVHLLPFGRTFLGFSRYTLVDETEQPIVAPEGHRIDNHLAQLDYSRIRPRRQNLWLKPDAFTVALVGYLSNHALQGDTPWTDVYPDFLGTVAHAHGNPYAASRTSAPPDALRIEGVWELPARSLYVRELVRGVHYRDHDAEEPSQIPVELQRPRAGGTGRSVQLKPDPDTGTATDRQLLVRVRISPEAADSDRVHRFINEQFRLLTRDPQTDTTSQHFPIGINYEQAARWVRTYPVEPFFREGAGGGLDLDLIFEVPQQARPWFLEYKLNARATVPPLQEESPPQPLAPDNDDAAQPDPQPTPDTPAPDQPPPPQAAQPPPPPRPQPTDERPRDRISGVRVAEGDSFFSDLLPFELTDYSTIGDMATRNDTVVGGAGRLIAPLDDTDQPLVGSNPPLRRFDVPEGRRLLQLRVNQLDPQSWLGGIIGHVRGMIPRYYLTDDAGNRHLAIGIYAIATASDGRRLFELVYFDEITQAGDTPAQLDRIRHDNLTGDYALYFLFHLPPGTRVQGFDTHRRVESLAHLDLVAPQ